MNQNLTKRIMIKPKYIHDKKYIHDIIYQKEKKCEKEGYIEKINKINDISFFKFYDQNFTGSILVDVDFNVNLVSLNINDVINCIIVKANEDGIVAQGQFPIFIIIDADFEDLIFLKVGDEIKVKIIQSEISIDRNIIRAVGKFISVKDNNIDNNKDDNEEKNGGS